LHSKVLISNSSFWETITVFLIPFREHLPRLSSFQLNFIFHPRIEMGSI
jgi:hypothetical protein